MLYFIGLGLYDESDISLKGMKALKEVDVVYAEFYTSRLFGTNLKSLENATGIQIKVLNREQVEEENIPLIEAQSRKVALLTAGDPLVATTHMEMMIEAQKRSIETRIVHSSSIISAAPGLAGLQAYKFGKTTTIPRPEENYFPHSPYHAIRENHDAGLHSLILLDIQTDHDYHMTANEGLRYLLRVEEERREGLVSMETMAVVVARAGSEKPTIRADRIRNLIEEDFGGPLHCLIIPGKLHFLEAEALVILGGAPEDMK
jgi:diphthine synthase